MAKQQVEIRFGSEEAYKFSMLVSKETFGEAANIAKAKPVVTGFRSKLMPVIDDDEEFNVPLPAVEHICKVFGPLDRGALESVDILPRFSEVPAEVEHLEGR